MPTVLSIALDSNDIKAAYGDFFKEIRLAILVSHDVKIGIKEEPEPFDRSD